MSKVRTGSDVRNSADLQGLVTALILRQSTLFCAEDVVVSVNEKLDGSSYKDSQEVEYCVRRAMTLFCIEGILKYLGNKEYVVTAAFPAV